MDALMQAQAESIAALSPANADKSPADTNAKAAQQRIDASPINTPARATAARNVQVERESNETPRVQDSLIADSLAPVTAELDSIQEQLAVLLAAAPAAKQQQVALGESTAAEPPAARPMQHSLWVVASVLLNVAALGAVAAKQLWDQGEFDPVLLLCSAGLSAAFLPLHLPALARRSAYRPR
eukprot:3565140-Pleurochrysis_carterae.AAC.1